VELAATEERQVLSQQVLNAGFKTMAESLREAGYDTYGVSANFHLHKRFGMDQGFDDYTVFRFTSRDFVDSHLQKLLPKIRRSAKDRPYFLYVHYFDPHHPYRPDDSFLQRFRPADAPPADYDDWRERWQELVGAGYFYQHPEAMQALIDAYDGEVAGCDDSLAAWLEKLPRYDEALVVITADHGEAFGDHQNMTHAGDLYAETLRVPLLVKLPNAARAGDVVADVVSLVDLYPTFAEWAGAAKPDDLAGINLLDAQQLHREDDRLIFSTTRRIPGQHWVGVIKEGVKLLYQVDENKAEAYDVRREGGDRQDIWSTLPVRQQRKLQRQLLRFRLQRPLYPPRLSQSEHDDDLKKKMKELGYL
jgi:arylsulfatase A-like enzyme